MSRRKVERELLRWMRYDMKVRRPAAGVTSGSGLRRAFAERARWPGSGYVPAGFWRQPSIRSNIRRIFDGAR